VGACVVAETRRAGFPRHVRGRQCAYERVTLPLMFAMYRLPIWRHRSALRIAATWTRMLPPRRSLRARRDRSVPAWQYHLTRAPGKVDQNVQGPACQGANTSPSRRSTLSLLESSKKKKGPNCRFSLSVIVNHGSWPGPRLPVRVFNYPCENQSCVPDRHELASALRLAFGPTMSALPSR